MKKSFLVFLTLLFISVACQDDRNNSENGIPPGEQEVEFTFNSPVTYSAVANENEIVELDLVVCDKDGKFQYMRQTYYSDVHHTFRSILRIEDNIDIYFFTNCRSCLDESILVKDKSWDDIQQELLIDYTSVVLENKTVLPMWGQAKGVSISEKVINQIPNAPLLRAVASADVYFDLEGGLNFTPK
ncbi:MAG: hypothetical protein LIP01_04165 [Tannerellaceae bacterium]|nr:hypothetical protein [Tannerellaceae bacterium]